MGLVWGLHQRSADRSYGSRLGLFPRVAGRELVRQCAETSFGVPGLRLPALQGRLRPGRRELRLRFPAGASLSFAGMGRGKEREMRKWCGIGTGTTFFDVDGICIPYPICSNCAGSNYLNMKTFRKIKDLYYED